MRRKTHTKKMTSHHPENKREIVNFFTKKKIHHIIKGDRELQIIELAC